MKKVLICILSASILISNLSCKKDLNALPKDSRVADVAITDAKTAEIALNGAYYAFANVRTIVGVNKTYWVDHERTPAMLAGWLGYGFGQMDEETNRTDGLGLIHWIEQYKTLNTVNGVLQGVAALPEKAFEGSRKEQIIGESRFLRAYAHFKLLSYFGVWWDISSPYGVLLRDESSTKTNISKARSSVKESYDFILADLDDAIANAPAENEKYYATKWAAMVLKMRVLMSRGESSDYGQVLTLANEVIENSSYTLEPDVKDLFRSKGLSSSEVILGITPQTNQDKDPYARGKQYWPSASALYVATGELKDLLAGDPRQSWMIGSESPYIDYSPNTYYFTKYIAEGAQPSTVTETFYAIRLSEVYLLKAEAIVRGGGSMADAKAAVKEVMKHAGVTNFSAIDNANTKDALLLQIYYETVKSLVVEDGQEYMALLRLDFETVKTIRPTIKDRVQYIFPVPHEEFVYNPAFGEQNPGYSK